MQKINIVYKSTLALPPLPRFAVCKNLGLFFIFCSEFFSSPSLSNRDLFPLGHSSILHLHLQPQAGGRDHVLVPEEGCAQFCFFFFTCQCRDPRALGWEVVHVGFRNQHHLVSGLWCKVAEHEAGVSPRHLQRSLAGWISCWAVFQAVVAGFLGQQLGPQQAEAAGGDIGGVEPAGLEGICKRDSGQESGLAPSPGCGSPAGPALVGRSWQHHWYCSH